MNVDHLLDLKVRAKADLMARPGVVGVGVGYKETAGTLTDQVVIRVYVRNKRDDIPDAERIPAQIEGVGTDVIEGTFRPCLTASGGIGIVATEDPEVSRAWGGTMGLVVVDNTTGRKVGLSNYHVIHPGWVAGNYIFGSPNDDGHAIPGAGPGLTDLFGECIRGALGYYPEGEGSGDDINYDAAVFNIDSPVLAALGFIAGIGHVTGSRDPVLGEVIKKRGARTGLTTGTVTAVGIDFDEAYDPVRHVVGQFEVSATPGLGGGPSHDWMVGGGDSGSVFVAVSDMKVVGLISAGLYHDPDGGNKAMGPPMPIVEAAMNITVASDGTVGFAILEVDNDATCDDSSSSGSSPSSDSFSSPSLSSPSFSSPSLSSPSFSSPSFSSPSFSSGSFPGSSGGFSSGSTPGSSGGGSTPGSSGGGPGSSGSTPGSSGGGSFPGSSGGGSTPGSSGGETLVESFRAGIGNPECEPVHEFTILVEVSDPSSGAGRVVVNTFEGITGVTPTEAEATFDTPPTAPLELGPFTKDGGGSWTEAELAAGSYLVTLYMGGG